MPIIKYPAPAGAAPATPLARGTVYGITDQVQESTALGAYADPGQQAASIGAYANSSQGGVSAGFQASAVGTKSISIGYTPYAAGTSAIAIGDQANTSHDFATAIGIGAQAGYQSVAIGPSTTSSGSDSVVICGNSTGNNNIVISSYQSNAENGLIAIGGNEHTSLKIPGLGIDTTQASNGQTLVWNSTAGNTGSGAFEWQTAGGGSAWRGAFTSTPTDYAAGDVVSYDAGDGSSHLWMCHTSYSYDGTNDTPHQSQSTTWKMISNPFVANMHLINNGDMLAWSAEAQAFGPIAPPSGADPATPTTLGTVYAQTDGGGANQIVSLGSEATSVGQSNVVIGYNAGGLGGSGVAIGTYAQTGQASIAIGYLASAEGNNSISIGAATIVDNTISIGNADMAALKIPGVGIDTTTATDGQILVWNSTGGINSTGAFEWQTPGGGGGVPAPPSTPGAVLTSDPYGTGTTTWTKNPRHMAYRLTSPMEFVNYDTVAPTAITLCSEAEHNPELGYFAPGNYAIYLHQLTSMTFTEGGRAALFDGEPYTFMDPLGNSSPTVTYINNTGTTFGFAMGGFNGPSVITGKLSIEMCTLSMGYFLRATQ